MYVFAVPDDGVNTIRGRPCRGDLPDISGLCFVFLVPELLVQRLALLEYSPDERPETVMFLRGRELLAANDEQPIYLRSPDIATLDLRIFARLELCRALIFQRAALADRRGRVAELVDGD